MEILCGFFAGMMPLFLFPGIVVLIVWMSYNSRKKQEDLLRRLAEPRGLRVVSASLFQAPTLTGNINGHQIAVDTYTTGSKNNRRTYTRVRARSRVPLPRCTVDREGLGGTFIKMLGGQDIEIGVPDVDRVYRFRGGPEEDVVGFYRQEQVVRALIKIQGPVDKIENDWVNLVRSGGYSETTGLQIDEALQLVTTLADARDRLWHDIAARTGLFLTVAGPLYTLTGAYEGVQVTVQGSTQDQRVFITAAAPQGLPADLYLEKGTSELGDMMLDRMVSARGGTPELLHELLAQDGIREDLLAVVHAHPGSIVTAERVLLRRRGFSDPDLEQQVRDVALLVRSLERAVDRVAPESTGVRRPDREPTTR